MLLQKNANVNARDKFDQTPLHYVIFFLSPSFVCAPANHKSHSKLQFKKKMKAVNNLSINCIETLIKNGADLEAKNNLGEYFSDLIVFLRNEVTVCSFFRSNCTLLLFILVWQKFWFRKLCFWRLLPPT